jgi:hypothetical protein
LRLPPQPGTLAASGESSGYGMGKFSAVALLALVAAGCTPRIPVEEAFAVSALRATSEIPPEFAAFNRYDPRVNPLLAEQSCATPFETQYYKSLQAVPGEILIDQVRCKSYWPFFARSLGEERIQ